MTPEQFSHDGTAWINAIISLLTPLIALVGGVFGFIAFTKSKLNETRLNGQSTKIDNIQMNMTPPSVVAAAVASSSTTPGPTGTPNDPITTVVDNSKTDPVNTQDVGKGN